MVVGGQSDQRRGPRHGSCIGFVSPQQVRPQFAHMAPGMKDMLSYLVARDTMHQNQWLAAWEELGGRENHPIPNSFSQDEENQEFNYAFMSFGLGDDFQPPQGSWSEGKSYDGRSEFSTVAMRPQGDVPNLGKASEQAAVQKGQL